MPIYEYTCGHCERRFEMLVLSKASGTHEAVKCRHCDSADVTKNLSTFSARSASSSGKSAKLNPSSGGGGGGGGCGRPGGCGCH